MELTPPISSSNNIIAGITENGKNINECKFTKRFLWNVESKKLQYQVHRSRINAHVQRATIKTYIHSLPWQYIWFYLTSKEFEDVKATNHTTKAIYAKVKIFNLGICHIYKNSAVCKIQFPNNYWSMGKIGKFRMYSNWKKYRCNIFLLAHL